VRQLGLGAVARGYVPHPGGGRTRDTSESVHSKPVPRVDHGLFCCGNDSNGDLGLGYLRNSLMPNRVWIKTSDSAAFGQQRVRMSSICPGLSSRSRSQRQRHPPW
jgi:hypothetical protein